MGGRDIQAERRHRRPGSCVFIALTPSKNHTKNACLNIAVGTGVINEPAVPPDFAEDVCSDALCHAPHYARSLDNGWSSRRPYRPPLRCSVCPPEPIRHRRCHRNLTACDSLGTALPVGTHSRSKVLLFSQYSVLKRICQHLFSNFFRFFCRKAAGGILLDPALDLRGTGNIGGAIQAAPGGKIPDLVFSPAGGQVEFLPSGQRR